MSDAQAFDAALRENPGDRAGWCAYADYLVEQGDPRGEFMQVQLALEDESLPKRERAALAQREGELLAAHEREWLGELAPHLLDRDRRSGDAPPTVEYWWARGFLTEMRVEYFTVPLARAAAKTHAARFLRKLHVESDPSQNRVQHADLLDRGDGQPTLFDDLDTHEGPTPPPVAPELRYQPLLELTGAPWLHTLRVFQAGPDAESELDGWTGNVMFAPGLEHLVASMPLVEELYLHCHGYDATALFALPNLSRVQVLRLFGVAEPGPPEGYAVPLYALARNAALGAITHLLVHPQFDPDESFLPLAQVRELVNSPHLTGLSHLQLRLSDMGDEGVGAIIESGVLKRLGWLDLRNGTITDAGARLFAGYGLTRNLRRLDLSRNNVSSAGLGHLTRAGVNAVADNSITRRESEERERAEREADTE